MVRHYYSHEWVKVLVTQSCPTLHNPLNCSLPDSSVHGILQEKYWSELRSPPPPGSLPNPGNESGSPELQADPLMSKPPGCMPYVCVCA